MKENPENLIFGINPVLEALRVSGRQCFKVVIEKGKTHSRIRSLQDLCRNRNVRMESLPRNVFQKKFASFSHQGVVGYFSEKPTLALNELIQQAFNVSPQPTLVLLDGIQDPQNLGAIIRSADALGIHGMVLPRHRAASLTPTVAKCASGAIEKLPIAWVTNLAQAIEILKRENFWVVGVDPKAGVSCYDFKFETATALLIGGEGKGIRAGLRKHCDFTIAIPMHGTSDSLNASAASAVIFYEVLRQKNRKQEIR